MHILEKLQHSSCQNSQSTQKYPNKTCITAFSLAMIKHMTKATYRRKGLFELMVPEGSESIMVGEQLTDTSWITSTKQKEWTGNNRRLLKPQIPPQLKNFLQQGQSYLLNLSMQHYQQGAKYSNAWDLGWYFIETPSLKNQVSDHVYLQVLVHKQLASTESWR